MTASTPLVVTFAISLSAMVAIGVIAWRNTKNVDVYILGWDDSVAPLLIGRVSLMGFLVLGLVVFVCRWLDDRFVGVGEVFVFDYGGARLRRVHRFFEANRQRVA